MRTNTLTDRVVTLALAMHVYAGWTKHTVAKHLEVCQGFMLGRGCLPPPPTPKPKPDQSFNFAVRI